MPTPDVFACQEAFSVEAKDSLPVLALVPAYNPDETLLHLVAELEATPLAKIVIVNDGSLPEKEWIFSKIVREFSKVTVLWHVANLGKGAALKTGLNHCLTIAPSALGVVTLDADGQHLIPDVIRVAKELAANPASLVLGVRTFSKDIPLRSRFGNIFTAKTFKVLTGVAITDTQTGLRGIPMHFVHTILHVRSTGYDFELDMLIHARQKHIAIYQVPIETVYFDKNCSSHFNPLLDSLKIYMIFVRYIAVALISFFVDYLFFIVLFLLLNTEAWVLHLSARILSSVANFSMNKYLVFQSHGSATHEYLKYFCVMAYVLVFSTVQMYIFNTILHISPIIAKPIADGITFLISFSLLNVWVFRRQRK